MRRSWRKSVRRMRSQRQESDPFSIELRGYLSSLKFTNIDLFEKGYYAVRFRVESPYVTACTKHVEAGQTSDAAREEDESARYDLANCTYETPPCYIRYKDEVVDAQGGLTLSFRLPLSSYLTSTKPLAHIRMELLFHVSDIKACQRVASRSLALYGRQCPHHTWADEVNFGFMHMGAISLVIALIPVAIAPFDGSSEASSGQDVRDLTPERSSSEEQYSLAALLTACFQDAKNRAQLGDAVSSSGAQRSTLRRSLAHMAQHDPWEYLLSARHRHFASQAVALTAALFTDEESTGEGDAGEASHTAGQQIVRFSKALLVLFAETAALLNRAADIVKSKERVESTDARLCSPQAGGPSFAAELAAVLQSLGNQIEQLSFQIFTTNSSQVGLYQALAADTARATAAVLLDSSCYSDPFVRDLGSDAYFLGHRVPSWSTVLQRERHDRMLESIHHHLCGSDEIEAEGPFLFFQNVKASPSSLQIQTSLAAPPAVEEHRLSGASWASLRQSTAAHFPQLVRHDLVHPRDDGSHHLFVCVHGMNGCQYDLRLFRLDLQRHLPKARFLMSRANEHKTHDGCEMMADRLEQEVVAAIAHLRPTHVSFVGHSLGAVIVRTLLSREHVKALFASDSSARATLNIGAATEASGDNRPRLHTFLSLAGPHLGVASQGSLVATGMWFMAKLNQSKTIPELELRDASDLQQRLLYRLSKDDALSRFSNVVLVASHQDKYVPWASALMLRSAHRPQSARQAAEYDMAKHLYASLSAAPSVRVFRVQVIHGSLSGAISKLSGRAAHIAHLDSGAFIRRLSLWLCALLMDREFEIEL